MRHAYSLCRPAYPAGYTETSAWRSISYKPCSGGLVILQEVLQRLDRPLLSTSVHVEKEGELEFAEGAVMMDMFAGCGLDFVVDCGMRVCLWLSSGPAVPSRPGCVGRIALIVSIPAHLACLYVRPESCIRPVAFSCKR